jgi:gluconate kinase
LSFPTDILFVLGPAGVGKSHLSSALAKKLDYLFYEVDQYPAADGIDAADLRDEWNAFYIHATPGALLGVLKERVQVAGKDRAVLSFPSMLILKGDHLRALRGRVRVVYLTGTEEQCRDAFLAREQKTGRGLGAEHREQNNKAMFLFLETEEAKLYSVAAFKKDGSRRSVDQVLAELAGDPA